MISKEIKIGYSTKYIEINDVNIAFMKSYSDHKGIDIMVPGDGVAHLISFDDNNEFLFNLSITQYYNFDLDIRQRLRIIGVDIV